VLVRENQSGQACYAYRIIFSSKGFTFLRGETFLIYTQTNKKVGSPPAEAKAITSAGRPAM
jgi:hypothetical protein